MVFSSEPSNVGDEEMFSKAPLLVRLVSASVRIAERAGVLVREILNDGSFQIVEKGLNDLQTEADRRSQKCIISSLKHQFKDFPKLAIIGEEGEDASEAVDPSFIVEDFSDEVLLQAKDSCPAYLASAPAEKFTIWVDPLDGTAEFTQSKENKELREHVTILIGIAHEKRPVAGIIYQPFWDRKNSAEAENPISGRTIWGIEGIGSFGCLPKLPPADQNIITTTRSHSSPEVQATIQAMNPTKILAVGGAGHKVLLVIEGIANAYVFASPGCKKWDTCAPEAILNIFGGKLTDLHGNEIEYDRDVKHPNSGGILATGPGGGKFDHKFYLDRIPIEIREKLKP